MADNNKNIKKSIKNEKVINKTILGGFPSIIINKDMKTRISNIDINDLIKPNTINNSTNNININNNETEDFDPLRLL